MIESEIGRDLGLGALSVLATHEPDSGRAAAVRARCHARLRRVEGGLVVDRSATRVSWRRALEPALVGSLCAVYLYEVLSRARELYRF